MIQAAKLISLKVNDTEYEPSPQLGLVPKLKGIDTHSLMVRYDVMLSYEEYEECARIKQELESRKVTPRNT